MTNRTEETVAGLRAALLALNTNSYGGLSPWARDAIDAMIDAIAQINFLQAQLDAASKS